MPLALNSLSRSGAETPAIHQARSCVCEKGECLEGALTVEVWSCFARAARAASATDWV